VDSKRPAGILSRYQGVTYESAWGIYEADLPAMAESGYFPVGQCWGWNPDTSLGFVVGGSSWKPGIGTLAVTYRFEHTMARSAS
jgi:hypothetical protein